MCYFLNLSISVLMYKKIKAPKTTIAINKFI